YWEDDEDIEEGELKARTEVEDSDGWGNCEWMRDWEERMQNAGATIIGGEGITAMEDPNEEAKDECIELGKTLAE
ncbi:flavodoxin domain protein, partial [Clostridioides difficile P2]